MWNQDCQDINKKVSEYTQLNSSRQVPRIRSHSLDSADSLDWLEIQDAYRRQFQEKRAIFNCPPTPSVPPPRVPRHSSTEMTHECPKYNNLNTPRTSYERPKTPLGKLANTFTSELLITDDEEMHTVIEDSSDYETLNAKTDSPVEARPPHQKPNVSAAECLSNSIITEPRHFIKMVHSEEVAAIPFTPIHHHSAPPIPPPRTSSTNLDLYHQNFKHPDKSNGNLSSDFLKQCIVLNEPSRKDRNTSINGVTNSVQRQIMKPVIYKRTINLVKANEMNWDSVDSMKLMKHANTKGSFPDSIEPIIVQQNVQVQKGTRGYTHPTPVINVDLNKSLYNSKNVDTPVDHTEFTETRKYADNNFDPSDLKIAENQSNLPTPIAKVDWKSWYINSLKIPIQNHGRNITGSYSARQQKIYSFDDQPDSNSKFCQDPEGDGWKNPVKGRNFSRGLYTPQPSRRVIRLDTLQHQSEQLSKQLQILPKNFTFNNH